MKKIYTYISLILLITLFFVPQNHVYAKNDSFNQQKVEGVMATAVKTSIILTWEPIKAADGYVIYEAMKKDGTYQKISTTTKIKKEYKEKERRETYYYKIRSYQVQNEKKIYGKYSKIISATVGTGKSTSTIKTFLQTAIAPVGATMYIWGGGWNKQDTAAGKDAKRIGLNPNWKTFAEKQTASYNYQTTKYQWGNGLDCSGFVGWTVYNILNTQADKKGYVTKAKNQASFFAEQGFGKLIQRKNVKNYRPGDIMSSACSCCGHVYIVIGQCSDSSVVLVHSSPKGVQINGTATPGGKTNSEAVKLAKKYMRKYYKAWYDKYPSCSKNTSYLTHYKQVRWYIGKNKVMSDPHGYINKSAEEILKDLFME